MCKLLLLYFLVLSGSSCTFSEDVSQGECQREGDCFEETDQSEKGSVFTHDKEGCHMAFLDEDDAKAEKAIDLYLEARKEGHNFEHIAEHIFNVTMKRRNRQSRHQHIYPFLSSFTLSAWADYAYLQEGIDSPAHQEYLSRMKPYDVIYVKGSPSRTFIAKFLPQIRVPFLLISHYHDLASPKGKEEIQLLENPLLVRWFTRNALKIHPKLEPIPIGFEPEMFAPNRVNQKDFDEALRNRVPFYRPGPSGQTTTDDDPKPTLAYLNFRHENNKKDRPKAQAAFANMRGSVHVEKNYNVRLKQAQFYDDVIKSKFVVSPPGKGEDCYRTWESILLGSIPIVRNSSLYPLYARGPVYITDDWDDVTEEKLLNFKVPFAGRKLVMAQYWFDRIDSFRRK